MRKFVIYNAIGNSYNLNDLDFFLENPEGLGMERDTSYRRIGSQFTPYGGDVRQKAVRGRICFKDPDAYDKYHAFALFIEEVPLRLEYTPSKITYSLDCYMQILEKTELELRGLNCPFELMPLAPFYRLMEEQSMDGGTGAGKIYDYTYPYVYSDSTPGSVGITSDTKHDSPCRITAFGELVNPRWSHYVNGNLVAQGRIKKTIREGHKLVIDTTVLPYVIEERDAIGNLVSNLYGEADFETERFFHLKRGSNRISIGHEGATAPRLIVEAKLYYGSV